MNTSARNWPRAILVLVLGIVVPMELPAGEAMEVLTKHIRHTQNNAELLLTGLR